MRVFAQEVSRIFHRDLGKFQREEKKMTRSGPPISHKVLPNAGVLKAPPLTMEKGESGEAELTLSRS